MIDINKAPKAPKKYKPLGAPKKGYTITESEVIALWRECYQSGLPAGKGFLITSETYKKALKPANYHEANNTVIGIENSEGDTPNDLRIINNNDWIED